MNRFAELLDRLAYEHGRNAKLRLLVDYFASVPDPDRGYALAAITGASALVTGAAFAATRFVGVLSWGYQAVVATLTPRLAAAGR